MVHLSGQAEAKNIGKGLFPSLGMIATRRLPSVSKGRAFPCLVIDIIFEKKN